MQYRYIFLYIYGHKCVCVYINQKKDTEIIIAKATPCLSHRELIDIPESGLQTIPTVCLDTESPSWVL